MSFDLTKAKVNRIAELTDPKWVKTNLVYYTGADGVERDWEMCSRRTRLEGCDCDGVGVFAILNKATGPEVLLQKQFRPPVEGICIEIPAGLLDAGDSIESCAERELLEETGYVGKAMRVSPLIFSDPGFCNTNMKIVHVNVDLSDPRNQDPKPQLEENEFIETFTVPLRELPERLQELATQGYRLDARIQNIADGIEAARTYLN